jgi:hypothetical protein
MTGLPRGEILFEFQRVGASVKVTAIHAETGVEVCLVGPAGGDAHALKMAAARKLAYVMGRSSPTTETDARPLPRNRYGV